MDVLRSNQFDIFMIYRRFCDIKAGASEKDDYIWNDESQKIEYSKLALAQLLNSVESQLHPRMSIIDELFKLMTRLDLTVDYSEFSRFYGFVFFICRENGQKSITVSRAVTAWRLVLAGRFRLLNEWCNFVEKNQRHNISEDTWRQVLSFSRCVHENLGGYDPEGTCVAFKLHLGAWPVLIDEFVEHMYSSSPVSINNGKIDFRKVDVFHSSRLKGSNNIPNFNCSCGDFEAQPSLKSFPGLKRKTDYFNQQEMEVDNNFASSDICKRRHINIGDKMWSPADNVQLSNADEFMESSIKQSPSSLRGSKSPCAVEGCLAKGFAGLFSTQSRVPFGREPFGRERRVS
ncbi:defective in cullin neddylation protein AAR3 isoform X2 [Apium graveolens]|uniref:defective in cullin neddylation protein AAR3 isoform X2 n=1 Tax=Apium graveolens TaxID=4045 RepID=UPI003D7A5F26